MKPFATRLWVASSIAIGFLATLSPTRAQIVPDNTLPVNSSVTSGCTVCTIDGGTIRGTNLFHSFQSFSVPTGGEAFFNNALQIQNILTRVTGNSVSSIDGLLRANGTANLFFLNPNGIIFGQNATLNLGGSFFASTASSLVFADGTVFSASPDTSTPPLLTISVPIGLQFGTNPGRMVVQGNGQGTRSTSKLIDTNFGLRVQQDQTLALVGGDIALEGATLKTAGGRIELGSVAGPGLVTLTGINKGWTLGYQGVSTLRDIQMSQQATVDASGLGGGDIQVWGRRVTLTASLIEASTLGEQPGGTLAVNATESVQLGTSADGQNPSGLFTDVYRGASGKAGDLTINTGTLLVRDGSQVSAGTRGQGDGGNLTVNASKDVQLIGISANGRFPSGLFASAQRGSSGKAGDLTINTPTLLVRDQAQVSAGTFGQGDGGNLTINTGTLLVRDGAQINASTSGGGDGGNLTVNASKQVQLIGTTADGQASSGLFAQANRGASGKAGDLTINTGSLLVRDGAVVSASTFGGGNGGNLTVNASTEVQLIGTTADGQVSSGLFASAQPGATGKAGDVTINTSTLLVQDGAGVSVRSFQGQAGNMTILANSVLLNRGRLLAVTAKSGAQAGANITLSGLDLLRMDNESLISANALNQANGGNITIGSTFIVATPPTGPKGSDITANAGQGNGGAVNVTTQGLYGIKFRPQLTPKNDITVSSEFGVAGQVNVNQLAVDPTQGLAELPSTLTDPSNQIVTGCAAAQGNSFIVTGRGGLPEDPTATIRGQTVWRDFQDFSQGTGVGQVSPQKPQAFMRKPSPRLLEANSWAYGPNGEVILIATAPNVTLHGTWQPPVNCPQVSPTEIR
jgi:filamentous hemagglutinin family protein